MCISAKMSDLKDFINLIVFASPVYLKMCVILLNNGALFIICIARISMRPLACTILLNKFGWCYLKLA